MALTPNPERFVMVKSFGILISFPNFSFIEAAIGWLDEDSASAQVSRSSFSETLCGSILVTSKHPFVKVPVLSKATIFVFASV